jgi:hypothetical protein
LQRSLFGNYGIIEDLDAEENDDGKSGANFATITA